MEQVSIDVNELIQMSSSARAEREKTKNERYDEAYTSAIAEITKNASEKMQESARRGYEKSILYQFKYNPDPSSELDENGVRIKFNGIWMLDMLIKGHNRFFELLNNHFNQGLDEAKFRCFFQKREVDNSYRIFVSWSPPRVEMSSDKEETKDDKVQKKVTTKPRSKPTQKRVAKKSEK